MLTSTSPQNEQSILLSRIYSTNLPTSKISVQGSTLVPEVTPKVNLSLEAISYKLQDIRLRLLTRTDLRTTQIELQPMILELCKSLEQAILHIHEIKNALPTRTLHSLKPEGFLLSKRQVQALHFASQGLSNKDIAEKLNLRAPTVSHHLSQAYKALGVRSRGKAIAICREKRIF